MVAEACGNRLYLFRSRKRIKQLREGQIFGHGFSHGYCHNQTPFPDPDPASRLGDTNLDFADHQSMFGRDFLPLSS